MVHESAEKILSDVEKQEFENNLQKTSKFPKFLLFSFVFLLFLVLLFTLNTLSQVLQKPIQLTKNVSELKFTIQNKTKQKASYDFYYLWNYPKNDDYSAKAIVVYDINSNRTIFEKNSDQKNFIASLTKLASTKVIVDNINLDNPTVISEESAKYDGSPLVLKAGQIFSNRDLLKATIIVSSNQAAFAMQDPSKTVQEMNRYAEALKLKSTNFSNPAGFDDDNYNYSTAKDLVPIARIFFETSILKDYASTNKSEILELTENKTLRIVNTNELLRNEFYPVIAGKTGTTPRAGQNLTLLIEKNNKRYLIIIVGSADRYKDAMMLIDRI